jgi:hypothetical protein
MRLFLGTDEAGYGPNLGPLVIAGTAWQVPDRLQPEAMYAALDEVVCCGATRAGDGRLAIGDSKQLYKPGGGLAALERGVLTALAALGRPARTWAQWWPLIDEELNGNWRDAPWHQEFDEPLPIDSAEDELLALAANLDSCCTSRDIRLVGLQASVLPPGQFNQQVRCCGNKAEVLSLTTLALARRMLERLPREQCPAEDVHVLCDRHGGRARYAALLQHVFPDELVVVRQETSELGVYALTFAGRRVEFRFLVGGERMLPTALASMTAKYARELAMRPFNAFWQRHVPGLQPTAGYPMDAKRFIREIGPTQRKLGIADADLWRER